MKAYRPFALLFTPPNVQLKIETGFKIGGKGKLTIFLSIVQVQFPAHYFSNVSLLSIVFFFFIYFAVELTDSWTRWSRPWRRASRPASRPSWRGSSGSCPWTRAARSRTCWPRFRRSWNTSCLSGIRTLAQFRQLRDHNFFFFFFVQWKGSSSA